VAPVIPDRLFGAGFLVVAVLIVAAHLCRRSAALLRVAHAVGAGTHIAYALAAVGAAVIGHVGWSGGAYAACLGVAHLLATLAFPKPCHPGTR
jgi:hypothetical protein